MRSIFNLSLEDRSNSHWKDKLKYPVFSVQKYRHIFLHTKEQMLTVLLYIQKKA